MNPYQDPPPAGDWQPDPPRRERRSRSKTPNRSERSRGSQDRSHVSQERPHGSQERSRGSRDRAQQYRTPSYDEQHYEEDMQRGRAAWERTSPPSNAPKRPSNHAQAYSTDSGYPESETSYGNNSTPKATHTQSSHSSHDAAVLQPSRGTQRASRGQRNPARGSDPAPPTAHEDWNMSMPDALEQLSANRSTDPVNLRNDFPGYNESQWQVEQVPPRMHAAASVPRPTNSPDYEYSNAQRAGQYGVPPSMAPPQQYMDHHRTPSQDPHHGYSGSMEQPNPMRVSGSQDMSYPQQYPPVQPGVEPDQYGQYPPQNYGQAPQSYGQAPQNYGQVPQDYGQQQQQYPPVFPDAGNPYNHASAVRMGSDVVAQPFPVVTVDASNGALTIPPTQMQTTDDAKLGSTHRIIPDIPVAKANRTEVRWFASILVLFYIVSSFYYFYVRFAYTLGQGNYPGYGYFVLAVELMGVSAMVPYAVMQWRVTLSNKTPGLPVSPPMKEPIPNPWFHVRVMVPCYKEDMDVISNTVMAALTADLPPMTLRTVYLCDDGKSPEKEEFINNLRSQGYWAEYVTGRTRKPHEINGKSGNLNNVLRNIIYDAFKDPVKGKITKASAAEIPLSEVIVVFDADMVAQKNFFVKILEAMVDDEIALCLTPQAFSNVTTWQDLFNNINLQFWQYILPGSNAMGYIACTGTNFCIRARPLASVGFFPEYTITEDYALGMELAKAGYKGTYLNEYLARGEAPTEARNVFRQRSRWTKGHMQVFFSHRCPVFNYKLSFANKWLYTNGTWAYFATIITTPTFIIVPFISLVFGIHPVAISRRFAIAATLYFFSQFMVQSYIRSFADSTSLWWSGVSNHVLCFTYFKAVLNVLISKLGLKTVGFKATDKGSKPNALQRLATTARNAAEKTANLASMGMAKKKKAADKGCCYFCCCCCFPCNDCCCPNVGPLQGTWDAHVLLFSFLFSMVAVGCGILRVYLDGIFQPFTVLPIFWALYNAIPPYLFLHYMFTKGWTFKSAAFITRILSVVFGILALGALWLSTNKPYILKDVLSGTVTMMDVSRSGVLPTSIVQAHPWRGPSMQKDGSDLELNLTGGFFVNGASNVKWNFPLASSLALMTWSYIEFPQAYKKAGSADRFLDNIRWGGDYMMNAHKDAWSFVAQVGDPEVEAQQWVPPEQDDAQRPSYLLTKDKGGADMFAAASAALTSASIAFNATDAKYSQALMDKAKSLFELAKQSENTTYCNYDRTGIRCFLEQRHVCPDDPTTVQTSSPPDSGRRLLDAYHSTIHSRHMLQAPAVEPKGSPPPPPCKNVTYDMYYNSTSSYDDLAWAAAWLLKATGDKYYHNLTVEYLDKHKKYEADYGDQAYYISNWNNMVWATNTLMYGITKEEKYGSTVRSFVKTWVTGKSDMFRWPNGNDFWVLSPTPKGLAFTPNHTLPQLSNTLFLTHLYTKTAPQESVIRCWVKEQLNYMMGKKGSSERSFVVGFGDRYPKQPMSRSGSCANPMTGKCSWDATFNLSSDNPNVLKGALVNGPDNKDGFVDLRRNDGNRVGLDNNAGFMGLVAAEMQQAAPDAVCQERHGLYNTMFEEKQYQNKLKKTVKDKLREFFGL